MSNDDGEENEMRWIAKDATHALIAIFASFVLLNLCRTSFNEGET